MKDKTASPPKRRNLTAGAEMGMSPALRRFLYATAAISGAAILIIEILGAKMLAPYVGTSHFVWTAQIAVTLVALSAGYYVGGHLVDRSTRLGYLYLCILVAAVYLCLAVVICEPVAYWCLQFRLALGALLSSVVLFLIPLTLLGTTTPFLVRILAQSLDAVGGQVGRLSAISTLGSVAGTVLIGYVLIPFLPNSVTMLLTAGFLVVMALGYFFIWGRKERMAGSTVLGLFMAVTLGVFGIIKENTGHPPGLMEIYRANSNFGLLQVFELTNGGGRVFLNDYLYQNGYDPAEKKSLFAFTYMLHGLARAYNPRIHDVLCIGMGVGIVPMQFAQEGARVDVVEINPAVLPLAVRFFDLEPDKLNIVFADGRYFLNQTVRLYDAIVLDAFLGDSSPSHLMTREAFHAVQRHLKPGGTLVMNTFGEAVLGQDFMTASVDKTLESVFSRVRIHTGGGGNVFFVAADRKDLTFVNPVSLDGVHPAALEYVKAGFNHTIQANPAHGRVLTDDYNPVEYYDAANREFIRRQNAMSVRPQ